MLLDDDDLSGGLFVRVERLGIVVLGAGAETGAGEDSFRRLLGGLAAAAEDVGAFVAEAGDGALYVESGTLTGVVVFAAVFPERL